MSENKIKLLSSKIGKKKKRFSCFIIVITLNKTEGEGQIYAKLLVRLSDVVAPLV